MAWWFERLWERSTYPPELESTPVPFLAIFVARPQFDYRQIQVKAFPGLLYVQALRGAEKGECRVLSCWRYRSTFEAARPLFLSRTGLDENGATLDWSGSHLGMRRPDGWKKYFTFTVVWAVVATLFAALGYAEPGRRESLPLRPASPWPPRLRSLRRPRSGLGLALQAPARGGGGRRRIGLGPLLRRAAGVGWRALRGTRQAAG
jgi:hypothetical protein